MVQGIKMNEKTSTVLPLFSHWLLSPSLLPPSPIAAIFPHFKLFLSGKCLHLMRPGQATPCSLMALNVTQQININPARCLSPRGSVNFLVMNETSKALWSFPMKTAASGSSPVGLSSESLSGRVTSLIQLLISHQ